jgi:hypothetical protein
MAEIRSNKTRVIKRILIGITLFMITAMVAFQAFGVEYIRNLIIKQVEKDTNGRYELVLDEFEFSFVGGYLYMGGVTFQRDTLVHTYSGEALLDKFNVYGEFNAIDVSAFKWLRLIFGGTIHVNELKLLNPLISIEKNRNYVMVESTGSDSVATAISSVELADSNAMDELKEATREFFPPITVGNLSVLGGYFTFYDGLVDYPIQKIDGLSLVLSDVYYEDGSQVYDAEDLNFHLDSASTLVSQNMAKLSIEGLYISYDTFHINNLHYGHLVSPAAVNRIKGFRASWLNIDVNHINLQLLDFGKMVEENSLLISQMNIGSLYVHFFKHKQERRINPEFKPLPQELLQSIPFKFAMDRLNVRHASVLIEMQAPDATSSGILTIDSASLSVANATNIPSKMDSNPVMELNLTSKLMKEAPASLSFKFILNSPQMDYQTELNAGPMPAALLNGFLGSQFFIEFKSGYIDKIKLSYKGNNRANVGNMVFNYRNLRLSQLKNPELYMVDSPKRKFLSGVANMLIAKNNTPDMKKYHTGLVFYEREYNRDFMHGMIMSLLSGLMSSLGYGNQSEETVQRKLDALDGQSLQRSAKYAQDQADKVDAQRAGDAKKLSKDAKKRIRQEERAARKKKEEQQ